MSKIIKQIFMLSVMIYSSNAICSHTDDQDSKRGDGDCRPAMAVARRVPFTVVVVSAGCLGVTPLVPVAFAARALSPVSPAFNNPFLTSSCLESAHSAIMAARPMVEEFINRPESLAGRATPEIRVQAGQ